MPTLEMRCWRRMWSMVLNAALRSREREREREKKKRGKPINSCMVDRVKELNETGFRRVVFVEDRI